MKHVSFTYSRTRSRQILHSMLLLFTAFGTIGVFAGRHADAASPPKNIVLVLTDDQTFESLEKMPYTSGRTDWIRFDRAFISTPLCCPSRATLLSGQYDFNHLVSSNVKGPLFDESTALPTWLSSAGYHSALVGKYLNSYPFRRPDYVPPGWSAWQAFQSGASYYNYNLVDERLMVTRYGGGEANYSTDVLAANAVEFVRTAPEPFLLYFAPLAAHAPFKPARRHRAVYRNEPIVRSPSFNEEDVSDKPAWIQALPLLDTTGIKELDRMRRNGWGTLLAVDEAVRRIFDALSARGVLDSTVVIFMTDNGYSLGEHRWSSKRCAYEECIRTPLLVYYPGAAPRVVPDLVSNLDVAPTLAEIAGVTPARAQDGVSLMPLINGTATSWRSAVLLHWSGGDSLPEGDFDDYVPSPGFWGLRTRRYKYVELETGERELYDLQLDPAELDNRIADPSYESVVNALALELEALKH